MQVRQEQIAHFQKEACLQQIVSYREFVRPTLKSVARLLDLGTGAGYGILAVSDCVEAVIATDVCAQMVEAARRTCLDANIENVSFREMSAEQLDFPDESFGAVQIRYSLHHFHDAAKALTQQHADLSVLYEVKRRFVQRQAARTISPAPFRWRISNPGISLS